VDSIFSYFDFRLYLKDWHSRSQSGGTRLTYRTIAEAIGLKSAAHITQIINGRANLSPQSAERCAALCRLNKKETAYFQCLVAFNQEKDGSRKNQLYRQLIKHSCSKTVLLTADQYRYYQKWYYAVIHDILSFYPFTGAWHDLARMVDPPITARQAQTAVKLLMRLQFIEQKPDGSFTCRYPGISAYSGGHSPVIKSYAAAMIDKAKSALETVPDDERLISWAGFSISHETYRKMKDEAREFRKKLVAMAQADPNPEQVYHLNLQLFPVSKKRAPSPPPEGE